LVHIRRATLDEMSLAIEDCMTGVDAEAMRSHQDEEYAKGEEMFAKAVKLAPDYREAWSHRGLIATLLQQYDEAVKYLEVALEAPDVRVNAALTRADLGWARFYQEDYVGAAKELLLALQFQPN